MMTGESIISNCFLPYVLHETLKTLVIWTAKKQEIYWNHQTFLFWLRMLHRNGLMPLLARNSNTFLRIQLLFSSLITIASRTRKYSLKSMTTGMKKSRSQTRLTFNFISKQENAIEHKYRWIRFTLDKSFFETAN